MDRRSLCGKTGRYCINKCAVVGWPYESLNPRRLFGLAQAIQLRAAETQNRCHDVGDGVVGDGVLAGVSGGGGIGGKVVVAVGSVPSCGDK